MRTLDVEDGKPWGIVCRHPDWHDHLLAVSCLPSEVPNVGPATTGSGEPIHFASRAHARMTAELWEALWGRIGWQFLVAARCLVPRWCVADSEEEIRTRTE